MAKVKYSKLIYVIAYTIVVHTFLFIYDLMHPEVFLHADRALPRLNSIQAFWLNTRPISNLIDFLGSNGVVGDYFIQGVLYGIVGQFGLIIFQLMLFLVSVILLYKLVSLIFDSEKIALMSIGVYIHLPHTLVFPHQLISEAIFIPLVIYSFYFLVRYLAQSMLFRDLMISAVFLGFSALVRPLSVVWPIIVFIVFAVSTRCRFSKRQWFSYILCSILPLFLWMTFMLFSTGKFGMGSSGHSLSSNLYIRAVRIAKTMPSDKQDDIQAAFLNINKNESNNLSVGQYFKLAINYPTGYVKQIAKDGIVFIAKSGINRLILDYFYLFPELRKEIRNGKKGWRTKWEQQGFLATVIYYFQKNSLLILITCFGLIVFFVFMLFSACGAYFVGRQNLFRKDSKNSRCIAAILILFPCYIFTVSQFVDAMQSRHRAPAEFALCILFSVAYYQISNYVKDIMK